MKPARSGNQQRPASASLSGLHRPGSSLPPGYVPPHRGDLQETGMLARGTRKTTFTRRQLLWLVGGAVGFVVVIAIVATIALSSLVIQATISATPDTVLSTFYSSLRTQDYTQAYSVMAPNYRALHDEASFASRFSQIDVLNGSIVSFEIQTTTTSGNRATATILVHRSSSATAPATTTQDTVQMELNSGSWYIDSIVTSTQISTPAT